MIANKLGSRRSLKSDLARVDAHQVRPEEYEELPELTDDMLVRARVNKGGRPVSPNPRKLISLRLQPMSSSDGRPRELDGRLVWLNA